jgi:WD40 repeat protein
LEDDSVAYTAAAVGVCYKSEGHQQRFFSGHDGRITCIACAPDKRTVATGDGTVKSVVIIWDAITMKQILKITSKNLKKGVCQIAYSPSGKYLAITDNSENSNVIVVDAKTGAEVAVSKNCVGTIAFEDD